MRCMRCSWRLPRHTLVSAPAVGAGLTERGCGCKAPLEPVLDLPGWRLLRAEDEDGARLQVSLLGHVVAAIPGEHRGAHPALRLLLHTAADMASEQLPAGALITTVGRSSHASTDKYLGAHDVCNSFKA